MTTKAMTAKEVIIKTIGSLPDDVTVAEIMTCIKSLDLIKESDQQVEAGQRIDHESVMQQMRARLCR